LREPDVGRGARDVAVAKQRLEHRQEVEIGRAVHVFMLWMKAINRIDLTDNYRSGGIRGRSPN